MIFNALKSLQNQGSAFLYDLDGLLNHANNINNGSAKVFFACKANPLKAILETLDKANICFDVASEGELKQVLSLGVLGSKIIMTGPAKSKSFIKLGLENKISTFVIESPLQLNILEEMAKEYNYKPNVLLRLQLKWEGSEKNILGGDQITSLGMDIDTAKNMVKNISLPFLGFHVFQWGNILSLKKLEDIWEYTINICKTITSDFQVLDVGGGIGIVYDDKDTPVKWNDINNLIANFKNKHKLKEFWFELGRYMTGPFGYYTTTVVDVKSTYGKNIIVLEGGINHLTRPALISQSFPVSYILSDSNIAEKRNIELKKYSLYGPLCTSLDCLGEHYLPTIIKPGDHVIFKQVGAYGFTESMPFFLCHNLPCESVIENGELKVIRTSEEASVWLK